jgi:DNA-binding LytR/AlgR family response regulator
MGAERMPPVIFVIAHDRYALRAFELAAVDYLMKPFDAHELIRLRTTVLRVSRARLAELNSRLEIG